MLKSLTILPSLSGRKQQSLIWSSSISLPNSESFLLLFQPVNGRSTQSSSHWVRHASAYKRGGNSPRSQYSPNNRTLPLTEVESFEARKAARTTRWQYFALIGLGVPVFLVATYLGSLCTNCTRDCPKAEVPEDVSDRYNMIASSFDRQVDAMEKSLGIMKLRKKLAAEAWGDVCEVSIGTGRNLSFYAWDFGRAGAGRVTGRKVKSFTAVDKSQEMLEIAHQKFMAEYPGILGVRWIIQDASLALPNPPVSANERSGNKVGKKYDTIVQTMGLCSTPNPVALLKNLGNSIEPGGKILLLEHGKSSWSFINKLLDNSAAKHADQFGCWWNKDIIQIVKDSELKILNIKRYDFGTTYWIELQKDAREPEDGTIVTINTVSAGSSGHATNSEKHMLQ